MTVVGTVPTIRETLQALDSGELSAVELMKTTLTHIESTDADVKAWLDVRPRQLLEEAAIADRRRSLGKTVPPLLGIPIAVKDIVDVAGYQTQCSMPARADILPAARDAEVVHHLRLAGTLIVGKTVTQEAAAGVVSDPCRNPWDTTRIPGGSSGGSAASVANGTSLGAVGTDTGGSIRIPAALCGVVGLKPTYGRMPGKGIFPLSSSLDTPGPITRTVADAVAMYLVMVGRGAEVPEVWTQFPEGGTSLAGKRIGVLESFFEERIQSSVGAAFRASIAKLEELGAEIVRCDWSDAAAARTIAMMISRYESAFVHREALRTAPGLMGEALRSRVELGSILPADGYFRLRTARVAVRDSIADLYREHRLDAIAAPTVPATAAVAGEPVHYDDGTTEEVGTAMTRLTQPWNATGQPVISVPCGFDSAGLPIGLSLVGRPDEEMALAHIAHAYEQASDFWMQMPGM